MAETIRIILCDDHTVVRAGLRRVLEEQEDLEVVAEAGTAAEAIARAGELHPDVVVMDLGLPDASGIDATDAVLRSSPGSTVLVLTVHDDIGYLRRAFAAGATGYLVKDAADSDLVTAVRALAAGGEHVHPRLGAALMRPDASPAALAGPGGELSNREIEVLRLIALGFTNTEIAEQLVVSVRTVESHRSHIQTKLGVRSRAKLASLAREAGLLEQPTNGP
ncbi:response regulator transcription factor [Euzebya rosea]|uniref:response regulator transcription factor n=1 Tax=Euzebya rosea TaxID=2052804 RepID=UPI000D3E320B|nr:response regulator transcription factor [Euzebya rosea]